MQKHICKQLINGKMACQKEMQPKDRVEFHSHPAKNECGNECDCVYEQQVPRDCRHILHKCYITLLILSVKTLLWCKITKFIC